MEFRMHSLSILTVYIRLPLESSLKEVTHHIVLLKMLTGNLCFTRHYPLSLPVYFCVFLSRELVHFPAFSSSFFRKNLSICLSPPLPQRRALCWCCLFPRVSKADCIRASSVHKTKHVHVRGWVSTLREYVYVLSILIVWLHVFVRASPVLAAVHVRGLMGVSPW